MGIFRRGGGEEREAVVAPAVAYAAQHDPSFAPEHVLPLARQRLLEVQQAWGTHDRALMHHAAFPVLAAPWEHRLDRYEAAGWRMSVALRREPEVTYRGLVRAPDPADDRVVVGIDYSIDDHAIDRSGQRFDYHASETRPRRHVDTWTFARRGHTWVIRAIDKYQRPDAVVPLVPAPAAGPRAEDRARIADGAPDDPAVVAAVARELVAEWAEASDDSDDARLTRFASPTAVEQMLWSERVKPGTMFPFGDRGMPQWPITSRLRHVLWWHEVTAVDVVGTTGPTLVADVAFTGVRFPRRVDDGMHETRTIGNRKVGINQWSFARTTRHRVRFWLDPYPDHPLRWWVQAIGPAD